MYICSLNADSKSIVAEARRASFTPIIATCGAVLDREAELYICIYISNNLLCKCQTNGNLHFRTLLAGSELDFKFVF